MCSFPPIYWQDVGPSASTIDAQLVEAHFFPRRRREAARRWGTGGQEGGCRQRQDHDQEDAHGLLSVSPSVAAPRRSNTGFPPAVIFRISDLASGDPADSWSHGRRWGYSRGRLRS